MALTTGTRAGYASDWALFTDWCTAVDHPALPTTADTVMHFLTDNPAAAATSARRVTAIAHFHRRYGYPSPTRDIEVKQWLRVAAGRPRTLDRAVPAERIEALLRQIPTTGWPAGLFGRRDRMLLIARYNANLPRAQLAALTTEHLTVDPEQLAITLNTDTVILPSTAEPATCPGCAWILWRRMLHLFAHHAGTRRLTATLRQASPLADTDGHRCAHPKHRPFPRAMPAFLPLDRWGATAVNPAPISARSISTLTAEHITGSSSLHPDPHPPADHGPEKAAPAAPPPADPRTAAERYLQGLERRRRDVVDLAGVRDILNDLDHAAADLDASIKDLARRYGL